MNNQPTMKKNILTLAFLLGFFSLLNAQDITFGIKGGVNFNNIGILHHIGGSISGGAPDIDYEPNKGLGNNFGAYFRVNLNQFYIQPEVTFVSLKSNYELSLETSNWTQSSIDIPLLIGYKVYHPVSIYAGPVFSMINDRQLEGMQETNWASGTLEFEKSSVNIGVGLNVSLGRFLLDFRYMYGFTKVEEVRVDIKGNIYGTNLADLLEYNPSQYMVNLQIDLFNFGGEKKKRGSKSNWRNHKNL